VEQKDWKQFQITTDNAQMLDKRGQLGQSLLPGQLMVPEDVEVSRGNIVWYVDYSPLDLKPKFVLAEGPILDQFLRITEMHPARVERFARTWGVFDPPDGRTKTGHLFSGEEPIALWYAMARQARAIVSLASTIHRGETTNIEDWRTMYSVGIIPKNSFLRMWESAPQFRIMETEKRAIYEVVNAWLEYGAVRPSMSWTRDAEPTLSLSGWGLLGALSVQLMNAIIRRQGYLACSRCHMSYEARRRPRVKNGKPEPNYCPDCRKVSARERVAEHRRGKQRESV
jgi:hypothetical protein